MEEKRKQQKREKWKSPLSGGVTSNSTWSFCLSSSFCVGCCTVLPRTTTTLHLPLLYVACNQKSSLLTQQETGKRVFEISIDESPSSWIERETRQSIKHLKILRRANRQILVECRNVAQPISSACPPTAASIRSLCSRPARRKWLHSAWNTWKRGGQKKCCKSNIQQGFQSNMRGEKLDGVSSVHRVYNWSSTHLSDRLEDVIHREMREQGIF